MLQDEIDQNRQEAKITNIILDFKDENPITIEAQLDFNFLKRKAYLNELDIQFYYSEDTDYTSFGVGFAKLPLWTAFRTCHLYKIAKYCKPELLEKAKAEYETYNSGLTISNYLNSLGQYAKEKQNNFRSQSKVIEQRKKQALKSPWAAWVDGTPLVESYLNVSIPEGWQVTQSKAQTKGIERYCLLHKWIRQGGLPPWLSSQKEIGEKT